MVISIFCLKAQNSEIVSVGFYNLENFFDIYDDPNTKDEEYTPEGAKAWDSYKYNIKVNNMAYAVSNMKAKKFDFLPAVIGVCEVENKQCLHDLVSHELLEKENYGIVHYDSPYRRGVDCALLYKKDDFELLSSKAYTLENPLDTGFRSRDQLLVTGLLNGDKVSFIVNHWPSRWGGQEKSSPLREMAADLTRKIVDELLTKDPKAKIVVMGDLNDDPNNKSVVENLRAKGNLRTLKKGDLYNTSFKTFSKGNGTLAYRGKWNLFDQIIVSQGFLVSNNGYKFNSFKIVNKDFLFNKEGKYKGYPHRTHGGGVFQKGYSDHLPVYIYLKK
jgi:endonuclease/exonuclease/phosphatase family metal-dependent hydrolase